MADLSTSISLCAIKSVIIISLYRIKSTKYIANCIFYHSYIFSFINYSEIILELIFECTWQRHKPEVISYNHFEYLIDLIEINIMVHRYDIVISQYVVYHPKQPVFIVVEIWTSRYLETQAHAQSGYTQRRSQEILFWKTTNNFAKDAISVMIG